MKCQLGSLFLGAYVVRSSGSDAPNRRPDDVVDTRSITPRSGTVSTEQVSILARVFGMSIDDADLPRIADELQAQLALIERIDEIDLDGVDPALTFDPRWP